jgi:hypothetical protein
MERDRAVTAVTAAVKDRPPCLQIRAAKFPQRSPD